MEQISKEVIIDLLPVYISGEASNDTKKLVEEYAKSDSSIAKIITTGEIPFEQIAPERKESDDLEKKTIQKIQRNIKKKIGLVISGTALLLMIPFIAMQFDSGVNWSVFDFLVMGTLVSVTGFVYVFISGLSDDRLYQIATAIAFLTGFLLIWVNLAVGFIGSESNPVNLLYLGVLATGIAGAGMAKFKPAGMSLALFSTAFAQMLVPVFALLVSPAALNEPPGIAGIILLSGFFAGLFAISGLLYRKSLRQDLLK
ncbi:MAG: hypothetical protein SCALA702_04540 [Melioribacteraceae bacterium]|nr:MAG: hypothetical protein SCALA702_04540 [Melioribacteraceae bacterium]